MAKRLGRLTIKQILTWADAHHERTGDWPTLRSGNVRGAAHEIWRKIDFAMSRGCRGMPGGRSLVKLLWECRGVRNPFYPPPLTVKQVLTWADAHHQRTGDWPTNKSGPVYGSDKSGGKESWLAIEQALASGRRGLGPGRTLLRLLARYRDLRNRSDLPLLTVKQVLAWADAHRKRTGDWPINNSGPIPESPGDTWSGIDSTMHRTTRWRFPRTSLAKFLARYRGKQHPRELPRLTIKQVLAWADQHHRRTGAWPTIVSGIVPSSSGESWSSINSAFVDGCRGLVTGTSLAQVLEKRRGARNIQNLPRLTIKKILKWMDAHRERTGKWPTHHSGVIPGSGGQTWDGVQGALFMGGRGFRGGLTIAKFLDKHRGVRNIGDLPALRVQQILRWADGHHKRTGKWPRKGSGRVSGAPGEKWSAIDDALLEGLRGLRAGSSLPRLLSKHRGVRNIHGLPKLTTEQILKWVDAYYRREKAWPARFSGPIPRSGGEKWESINQALKTGRRGVRGGWSLARFLNKYRRLERGL